MMGCSKVPVLLPSTFTTRCSSVTPRAMLALMTLVFASSLRRNCGGLVVCSTRNLRLVT